MTGKLRNTGNSYYFYTYLKAPVRGQLINVAIRSVTTRDRSWVFGQEVEVIEEVIEGA